MLAGVQATAIVEDQSPPRRVYDPLPNVNTVSEMVDLITASRGYEANVQALNATKQLVARTLDILRS